MADGEKIAKELDQKRKSLPKTEEALKTANEELKKLETERDKAEKSAKSEKDSKKKKKFEESHLSLKEQAAAQLKKRDILAKAAEDIGKAITRLHGEAIDAFGESRTNFVQWFRAERAKADKIVDQVKRIHDGVIKEKDKTAEFMKTGQLVKAAEAAGTAGKLVDFAQAEKKKYDELHRSWEGRFTEQRNLAPKDFGLITADVQVHKVATSRIYEVFKAGDDIRDELVYIIDKTNTMSEEAGMILESGGSTLAAYEKMLARTAQSITAKISEYVGEFSKSWPKMIQTSGERFVEEIEQIKTRDPGLVQRALKVYEQGSAALPKVFEGLELTVKQANELLIKEQTRIPKEFEEALKPKLDKLANQLRELGRQHEVMKPKFAKAMERLEQLGKAAGA